MAEADDIKRLRGQNVSSAGELKTLHNRTRINKPTGWKGEIGAAFNEANDKALGNVNSLLRDMEKLSSKLATLQSAVQAAQRAEAVKR